MTLFLKTTFSLILILLSCSYSFTQSSANLDWVSTFGDVGSDWGYQVSSDTKGNIIVMGRFTGSIDLDRGVDTFMLRNTLGTQGLFICKMDYTGKPIWAQQLENNTAPPYNENILTTDTLGNVYFTGSFSTPMDVDPGPTTLMFNPLGFVDAFTIKLDKDGTFQWASQLGGNGARIEKNSISVDASGNVFLSGGLRGTADFDPGPGVNMQSSVAYDLALFVQKLDTHGNLLWVNLFKNKNTVNPHSAGTDSEGNFLLTSAFFDTLDVDPGPSVRTLISTGLSDIFLLKLDPGGNFSWVQQISGTSGGPTKASFGIDASNNIYVSGTFRRTIDLDPGPDSLLVTSSTNGNEISVFYQKFSAQGTFLWAGHSSIFPSPNAYINLRQITADPSGNFYTRGRIRGEADFDLGPDTTRLSSTNSMNNVFINNEYIAKYNTQGEFQWMRQIETDGIDLMDFTLDPDNNILFTGSLTSKGADFDPGPDSLILMSQNIYQEIFLGKWQQESPCSTLSLQIDQSIDATCSPGLVSGFATGGTEPYSYSWNDNSALTDTFLQVFTTGIYELSVTDSIGCSKSVSTLISAPRIITGSYLRVNTTALEFRSGFDAHIWLDAYNDGCVPVDGTLSLQLDPLLYFQGASISPDTIINKTLIWYIDDMIIDSPHVKIRVDVRVSTVSRRGDLLCVDTRIIPRNIPTFKSKNNQDNFCLEVVASYDPNDKRSNPQGICEEGYILNDEKITYTVRFQNIGDVDAVNIFILDTLDTDFDIDSLKVVGKSHEPMITEFLPGGVLKFRFDGIHLPDSTTDEPNSHGYVMFEVAPKANRVSGTELLNRAGIYFDFNDPVITNTVRNTLIDVLPTQDTTFVQAAGCGSYELNRRSYASSGTYFQHLQGTGSCDSIISLTLTLPNLDSTVSISGGRILQSNQVSDPGSPVNYQWLDCDNNNAPISGATQQQFTPNKNGNYAVMISQEGCSKISACTHVSTVGIDLDFLSSLTYYPNPTSGILHIEMGEPHTSINVKIFSPIGQLLDQIPYGPSEKLSIQLPEQVGVYFVELSVEGKVSMLKVLKR